MQSTLQMVVESKLRLMTLDQLAKDLGLSIKSRPKMGCPFCKTAHYPGDFCPPVEERPQHPFWVFVRGLQRYFRFPFTR